MSPPPPVQPPPVRKPEGRFHHGDLRAALLAAATELVAAEGHAALTLRRVAGLVGVTEPAVYRHFASKDALLGAVGAGGYERFLAACAAAAATASEPLAAAERALRAYVRFAVDHPHWFRLWSSRRWQDELGPAHADLDVARRQQSVAPLRALLVAGLAPDAPVDDVFRTLWALAHGLSHLVVERAFQLVETDEQRVAAADEALRVAFEGLRARWPR